MTVLHAAPTRDEASAFLTGHQDGTEGLYSALSAGERGLLVNWPAAPPARPPAALVPPVREEPGDTAPVPAPVVAVPSAASPTASVRTGSDGGSAPSSRIAPARARRVTFTVRTRRGVTVVRGRAATCSGTVRIRWARGIVTRAKVGKRCTFRASKRLGRRKPRVAVTQ